MRHKLFTIIISLMLISSLGVFAGHPFIEGEDYQEHIFCCYNGDEYEWESEVECLEEGGELSSSDNCGELEDDFDEEGVFCSSREECMSLCEQHPKKCKFEFEQRGEEGRFEEKLKIRGEYGDLGYKYKTRAGGEEIEVEFKSRAYVNYFNQHDIKPEYFIMGKMTEDVGQEGMRFAQMCPDVEGMVDAFINYLKESGRWNIERACNGIENELNRCEEKSSEHCENVKNVAWFKFNDEEVSCDDIPSKDRFYKICAEKMHTFEEEFDNVEDRCEDNWEQMEEGCESRREYCEIAEEEAREHDEEFEEIRETFESDMSGISGMSVAEGFSCDVGPNCNEEDFMTRCISEFGSGLEETRERSRQECDRVAEEMLQNFEQGCSRRDEAYNHCIEITQKHCGTLRGVVEKCRSVSEDDIKQAMLEQGRRMCKFMENEDEFVKKMLEAKGHFRKGEYDIVIEGEAEGVSEDKEEVEEIDDKGFGYKVKKFFCLAADEERTDAARLREIATRFKAKAELMVDLGEEAETEQGKTVLLEASVSLEEESKHLEKWSKEKEDEAAGLCSVFGGNEEESSTQ